MKRDDGGAVGFAIVPAAVYLYSCNQCLSLVTGQGGHGSAIPEVEGLLQRGVDGCFVGQILVTNWDYYNLAAAVPWDRRMS